MSSLRNTMSTATKEVYGHQALTIGKEAVFKKLAANVGVTADNNAAIEQGWCYYPGRIEAYAFTAGGHQMNDWHTRDDFLTRDVFET